MPNDFVHDLLTNAFLRSGGSDRVAALLATTDADADNWAPSGTQQEEESSHADQASG